MARSILRSTFLFTFLSGFARVANADQGSLPDEPLPATGTQSNPAVVWDGKNYVAAWRDAQAGFASRILVARLDDAGNVLDKPALVIGESADVGGPRLATCGGKTVVTWIDRRLGTSSYYDNVKAAVVTDGNTLSATPGVFVSPKELRQSTPDVASNGAECFLVWADVGFAGSSSVVGTRFKTTPLDPAGITIGSGGFPRIAHDGARYVVAWASSASSISVNHISNGGVVDGAPTVAVQAASTVTGLSIDGAPTPYLAWYAAGLRGSRLAPDGSLLDAGGTFLSAKSVPGAFGVAPVNDGHLVLATNATTQSTSTVFTVKVASSGGADPETALPLVAAGQKATNTAMAMHGQTGIALFDPVPRPVDGTDIAMHRLDADGKATTTSPSPVSFSAPRQQNVRVATSGSISFVGSTELRWIDRGTTYSYLQNAVGMRIDGDGTVLDPKGLDVRPAGATAADFADVGAANGAFLTLAVESPSGRLWARRYDAKTGVSSAPKQVGPKQVDVNRPSSVRLAWNGKNYLTTWQSYPPSTGNVVRLDDQGNVVGAPATLPSVFGNTGGSATVMASNGTGWMLARKVGATLHLAPVDASGTPTATSVSVAGQSNFADETEPAIASDGTGYFVVWSDDGPVCKVTAAYFDAAGVQSWKSAPFPMPYCSTTGYAATFDGTNFVVAFRDDQYHLVRARISPTGTLVDGPIVSEVDPGRHAAPALASLPSGHFVLAYERMVDAPPFGTIRARAQVLPTLLPPTIDPEPVDPDGGVIDNDGGPVEPGKDAGKGPESTGDGGRGDGGDDGRGDDGNDDPDGTAADSSEGGCGCTVAGQKTHGAVALLGLGIGLALLARRTRHR